MKTGKKDSVKLNCCHEEIVRIYSGVKETSTKKEAVCANCYLKFDSQTGGKCKHCKDSVLYCTAVCQVCNVAVYCSPHLNTSDSWLCL